MTEPQEIMRVLEGLPVEWLLRVPRMVREQVESRFERLDAAREQVEQRQRDLKRTMQDALAEELNRTDTMPEDLVSVADEVRIRCSR
jgi:hypothetical protein